MLQRVFGVSDLAIATVLATFFLGMGLGSLLGGRFARRVARPALAYAALEGLVGLWALGSLYLIPKVHLLYAAFGAGASFETLTSIRLLIAFAILLPPTMFMGATLPILIALVAARGGHWASSATSLYATNTFGAMVGAGVTGLYLLPEYGARIAVAVAATGSFAAAGIIFVAWRRARAEVAEVAEAADVADVAEPADVGPPLRSSHLRLALFLAATAGLAALASEVLWTRVLRSVVQGTTHAFAAMLVNYLAGIALGSLLADRIMRKGVNPIRAFAMSQLLLAGLTGLAMAVAPHLPRIVGLLQENPDLVPEHAWVVLVTSSLLLFPLALTLGTSIPFAWRIAGDDLEDAPKNAGRVLAANTIGGLVGSLLAGFFLVPVMGIEAALLAVICVHLVASSVAYRASAGVRLGPKLVRLAVPIAVGAAFLILKPSLELPFLLDAWWRPSEAIVYGPNESYSEPIVFLREGRNTTVTILRRGGGLRLYNDGRPESGFSPDEPGFGPELCVLGGMPSLFAEQRERAMVIGLGAGHSTSVVLGGPWSRVDVVELEGVIVEAARMLHTLQDKPFPLDDPRTHLLVDDGRAQLVLAEPGAYDTIVSQPSHPWLQGSSALYTQEFFQECDRALRPGGVMALWVNLFRMDIPNLKSVVATLMSVFPHVNAYIAESSSFVLMASDDPMPLEERVATRLATDAGLDPFLGPYQLDTLVELGGIWELDTEGLATFSSGAPLIEDDRPALEFALARIPSGADLTFYDLDIAFTGIPWLTPESYAAIPEDLRVEVLLERIDETLGRRRAIERVRLAMVELPLSASERHLLEGAIAERTGDLRGALTGYDASGTNLGADRADRLRYLERMHYTLLANLEGRENTPYSASFALSSAIALRSRHGARAALALDARVNAAGDESLARLTRAWLDEGCPAVLALPNELEGALDDEHFAFLAETCAIEGQDFEAAARFAERRMRSRRVISASAARQGSEVTGQNAGAAMRFFRRALAANPAHGLAAGGLARLLEADARPEEAAALLRRTATESRGLPNSTQAVEAAAEELGIDLAALPDVAPLDPDETSP